MSLGLPSVVLWIATKPELFGYEMNSNVVANLKNQISLPNSYLFDYNFHGEIWECPIFEDDILFNLDEIVNKIVNDIKRELMSLDNTNALSTLASGENIRDPSMGIYSAQVDVEQRDEYRRRMKGNDGYGDEESVEESGRYGEMYLKQKNPYSIVKKKKNEKLGDKFFVTYAHERPMNCFQINDNRMQLYIPSGNRYPNPSIDIIPTWSPAAEQGAQGAASIILRRRDEYETNLSDILKGIK